MRQIAALLGAALVCLPARAGDEQDKFEEQLTTQMAHQKANRVQGHTHGERGMTIRDLEAAFPGKVKTGDPGKVDNEAEHWFELVTGGTNDMWKKADATEAGLGPMYQRWVQRLELGPVPSIKKDEFLRFARMIIGNAAMMRGGPEGGPGMNSDTSADKAFRILDVNADDELTGGELSAGLKADKQADENGDGRISKAEYREYFKRQVEKKADTIITAYQASQKALGGINWETLDKPGAGGVPAWFAKFDADSDGQVSLFEWKEAGRTVAEFQDMDLNGDGLLTKDEYKRWQKKKQFEAAEKRRELGK